MLPNIEQGEASQPEARNQVSQQEKGKKKTVFFSSRSSISSISSRSPLVI